MKGAIFLSVIFLSLKLCFGDVGMVWEFGAEMPGNIEIGKTQGTIEMYERVKEIKLIVLQCYRVTYVKTVVQNSVSRPTVNYNKQSKTVTISYHGAQFSESKYTITVNGVRLRHCRD